MEKRDFRRARRAVDGLTLSTAVLAVAGVFAMFGAEPGSQLADALRLACLLAFAGVAGFSLWVAQAATGCAQVLKGDGVGWARGVAWTCAIVTGLVSIAGAHLGYAVLRGAREDLPPQYLVDLAGVALAFVKPAMSFVITACETAAAEAEQKREDERAARNRAADLEAAARRRASEKKTSQDNAKPAPRVRPKASARAARKLAHELSGQEPIGASKRSSPAPSETIGPEARDVSLAEIETACRKLIGADTTPSVRLVSSQLNVPKSRVEKTLTVERLKLVEVVERVRLAA